MRRLTPFLLAAAGAYDASQPSQWERTRGPGFAVPAAALENGIVSADLPPRMTTAAR